jgi:hypothetical protein
MLMDWHVPLVHQPAAARVKECARIGFQCGVVYSVFAAVILLVKGLEHGLTGLAYAPLVFGFYLGGGLAAGALVGLLLPLGQNAIGAAFLGIVVGYMLFYGTVLLGLVPVTFWSRDALGSATLIAFTLGAGMGLVVRHVFR